MSQASRKSSNVDEVAVLQPTPEPSQTKNERLAGKPPFKTLISLSFGPLMSQVSGSLYGFINTMWISRALGEIAMSSMATATSFDNIGRAFGYFLSVSASSKISALFALGLEAEGGQVFCDILRVALICGVIVPCLLVPLQPIVARWFGASELVVNMGNQYISPIFYCSVFTCLFLTVSGTLQAEGRTLLVGIVTLISLIVCVGGVVPLFLYVFDWGMTGAGIATVISEAIPGLVLIALYFKGTFTVKPKLNMLFKKFSTHSYSALRVGLSQLISNLSVSIPGIVQRKLIGMSVNSSDEFNNALAGFNVLFRYINLTSAVVIAFNMGYLPAASYANAADNQKRFIALTGHLVWVCFLWSLVTGIISLTIPRQVAIIFSDGDEFLDYGEKMLFTGNNAGIILFVRFNSQVILQAKQLGGRASIISLCSQLLSIIAGSLILYYTDKHNPIRLANTYMISYIFGLILAVIFITGPMVESYKRSLVQEQNKKAELDVIENEEESETNGIEEI